MCRDISVHLLPSSFCFFIKVSSSSGVHASLMDRQDTTHKTHTHRQTKMERLLSVRTGLCVRTG